jgi:hypothetical protein
MIPTFTLSKNDLAYLLYRTLAISSLRQSQGCHVHVSLSFPFLTIGEHKWLQRQEMRNDQNREFAVHGHAREALGYWVSRLSTKAAMRLHMHAGIFFIQGLSCWRHTVPEVSSSRYRLMGLHLRGSATILLVDHIPARKRRRVADYSRYSRRCSHVRGCNLKRTDGVFTQQAWRFNISIAAASSDDGT